MDEFYKGFSHGNFPLALATLLTLTHRAKARFKALPEEEQQIILKERAENEEHKRVEWCIRQGKCPYCGEKLIRGKKDKRNGYKRNWKCVKCDKTLTL